MTYSAPLIAHDVNSMDTYTRPEYGGIEVPTARSQFPLLEKFSATQAISVHMQVAQNTGTPDPILRFNLISLSGANPVIQDSLSHVLPAWMNNNSYYNYGANTGSFQMSTGDVIFYWGMSENGSPPDSGYSAGYFILLMARVGVDAGELVVRWVKSIGNPDNDNNNDYEVTIAEISPTKLAFLGNMHIFEIDAATGLTTFDALNGHLLEYNFIMASDTHFVMMNYTTGSSYYRIGTLNPLVLGTTEYQLPRVSYSTGWADQDRFNKIGFNKSTLIVWQNINVRNTGTAVTRLYPVYSLDSNGFIKLKEVFSSHDIYFSYSVPGTTPTYFDITYLKGMNPMEANELYNTDPVIDIGNGKYSTFGVFSPTMPYYAKRATDATIAVFHDLKPVNEANIMSAENPTQILEAPKTWDVSNVIESDFNGWSYSDFEFGAKFVNGKYVILLCDGGAPDEMFVSSQAIIFTVTPA